MNKKVQYKRAYKKSTFKRKLLVRIHNWLERLKVLFAIVMLITLSLLALIKPEPAVAQEPIVETVEIKPVLTNQVITLDDTYYLMLHNNYPWEVCNLTFYSYRHEKDVTAPQAFRETLYKYHDCNDQLLLTKIAHYESDFDPNSVNLSNTYAKGLYHVLPSTRNECSSKYGLVEENDCALWVIKNYPSWYLEGYKPYNYNLSF